MTFCYNVIYRLSLGLQLIQNPVNVPRGAYCLAFYSYDLQVSSDSDSIY